MKILIVYYSKSGNTKKVAKTLSQLMNADVDEINDLKKRKGFFRFLINGLDSLLKRKTKISSPKKSPKNYDLVIIGTPVWAGNMTPAIRTYLSLFRDEIKSSWVFCTMGGEGNNPLDEMTSLLEGKNKKNFYLTHKELKNNHLNTYLKDIINKN